MQRLILTTGGTGGHIFPALAVADIVRKEWPDCRILFVGGCRGAEKELATKAGLDFVGLPAAGVLGKGIRSLSSIVWLSKSIFKSWKLMRSFRPEVVIGFGGYAGFAPVLTASLMNIPCAIHEQNSIPGMTNKVLGRRVNRIFLSFEDQEHFFAPCRAVITGNPVRSGITVIGQKKNHSVHKTLHRVLVLGGSQGAKALNDCMLAGMSGFVSRKIEVLHQTGKNDFDKIKAEYDACGKGLMTAVPFIEDMAHAYDWADLVLCRAGATTLAELLVAGKPSVLVPFPYATHDHQMKNARYLEARGASLVIAQSYIEEVDLPGLVHDLLASPQKLKEMADAASRCARPEAARELAQQLNDLAEAGKI